MQLKNKGENLMYLIHVPVPDVDPDQVARVGHQHGHRLRGARQLTPYRRLPVILISASQ